MSNSVNDYVKFLRKAKGQSYSEKELHNAIFIYDRVDSSNEIDKKYKELLRRAVFDKGVVLRKAVTGKRHNFEYYIPEGYTPPYYNTYTHLPNPRKLRDRIIEICAVTHDWARVYSDKRVNGVRVKFHRVRATPEQFNQIKALSAHITTVYMYRGSLCVTLDCRLRDLTEAPDGFYYTKEDRADQRSKLINAAKDVISTNKAQKSATIPEPADVATIIAQIKSLVDALPEGTICDFKLQVPTKVTRTEMIKYVISRT